MTRRRLFLAAPLAVLFSLPILSAQPAAAQTVTYAPVPPPPPEAPPPPPPPGYRAPEWVLVPAHWHWNGVAYVWKHAHWARRVPGAIYAHWIPGGWRWHHNAWVWVPAHWGP